MMNKNEIGKAFVQIERDLDDLIDRIEGFADNEYVTPERKLEFEEVIELMREAQKIVSGY